MTNRQKKDMKIQQIKLGKTTKKSRAKVWEYILRNDLGVGYYDAQELSRKGISILKVRWDEDQPH